LKRLSEDSVPSYHFDAVADHPHPCRARDDARANEAPGNRAYLRDLEELADFRLAQHHFLLFGREQARHAAFTSSTAS